MSWLPSRATVNDLRGMTSLLGLKIPARVGKEDLIEILDTINPNSLPPGASQFLDTLKGQYPDLAPPGWAQKYSFDELKIICPALVKLPPGYYSQPCLVKEAEGVDLLLLKKEVLSTLAKALGLDVKSSFNKSELAKLIYERKLAPVEEKEPGAPAEEKISRTIPRPLVREVWELYCGKEYTGKCFCCGQPIEIFQFECGHIVSAKCGGKATINNLRPICSVCNRSMRETDMRDYMKRNGFDRTDPARFQSVNFIEWVHPVDYLRITLRTKLEELNGQIGSPSVENLVECLTHINRAKLS